MVRRIAVTGLGVLSPIGIGHQVFWQRLVAGTVGTKPIRSFDSSMFDVHNGGEVDDFDPVPYFQVLDPTLCGRTTQLAVAASRLAAEDSGVLDGGYDRQRIGICMGTTMGNQSIVEDENDRQIQRKDSLDSAHISHYPESFITAAVAQELAVEGPCQVIPTACAAGNYAISWGADLIRDGVVDVAIVGGADAMSRGCFAVFHRLGAIAPQVCQPFDLNRKGMMVSEGAGVLVLEDYEKAVSRGAHIYAELLGYGLACDAYHPTAPHPEGIGAEGAMRKALADAQLNETSVSYISAHGTGTRANDSSESHAVRKVFGTTADEIPTSSIKSMLGHTMGAASAIEAVTCALTIYHSTIPPTANFQEPDPECLQHIVPNKAISYPIDVVLSNAFAFGGNISTIIMGRVS
ncbi:beta-ketoacyl-[acyl-carrier-protein] synthase family protein [Brevibacillus humidisoli]|uniref:beta-ketoacyl-[acyl-carrier-protein] synthase family protein n=1 Tax=Brevibacillus humidisoli TaxID=2895522 RepID=UPI001E34C891|nr:beta-ketoacyl-[acyl-carrier-protein] synthase family protein [Brevibacillus humidisoli]UFJ42566.1 beta-ketoacyl-[acyl-carrier-protein] synthase family protein [Brevibacillus humidisoli]